MNTLQWLSPIERRWVEEYGYFLEAVWAHFDADGVWPDPVEVLRELRAANRKQRVKAALDQLPGALARRDYAPPRLSLTLLGLGCCEGARPLLGQYVQVTQLALERFDSPQLPNRLSRDDVVGALELDEHDADRLSQVLMQEAPFLGGGSGAVDSWERAIDPRCEEFEGVTDPDELLTLLAAKRGRRAAVWVPPPADYMSAEAPSEDGSAPGSADAVGDGQAKPRRQSGSANPWTVAAGLATVLTFFVSVAASPSLITFAALGLFAGATGALIVGRPLAVTLVLGGTLLGAAGGAFVEQQQATDKPHNYFVASTGETNALFPVIEPRPNAVTVIGDVLGPGARVAVSCIYVNGDREWAKLLNGSFVPADYLSPEVGSQPAPSC